MKRSISTICIILVALICSIYQAHANGYRVLSIKAAKANSMGEAVSARSDDPSAIAFNPAGLAGLEGTQVGLHLTAAELFADHKSSDGTTSHNEHEWQTIPALFLSTDIFSKNIVAGFGVTVPNGFFTEWDDSSFARYVSTYSELRVVDTTPCVGAKIGDSLMVGAGLDVLHSSIKLKSMVDAGAAAGMPGLMDLETTLKGDGMGIGYNVGLIYAIQENQRVALTYRSPVTIDYDGTMGGLGPELDLETTLDFPAVIVLGYMVDVSDKLSVEVDLDWTQWDAVDDITIDFDSPMVPDTAFAQDMDNTMAYKLGVEYQYSDPIALRGGYIYSEAATPEASWRPSMLDIDTHLISAGIGYTMDNLSLDLALIYVSYNQRTIDNNVDNNELTSSSSIDGKYEGYSPTLSMGATYKF